MVSKDENNNANLPDHANVAIHPPILFGLLLVAGFGAGAILPMPFLAERLAWIGGPIIVAAAFCLGGWGALTMRAGGGSIPTGEPTDVIVKDGPYRYSRNPLYLSMVLALTGIGVWANSLWFIGMAIVDAVVLSRGVIAREEAYLRRKFGSQYSDYAKGVRRWL